MKRKQEHILGKDSRALKEFDRSMVCYIEHDKNLLPYPLGRAIPGGSDIPA